MPRVSSVITITMMLCGCAAQHPRAIDCESRQAAGDDESVRSAQARVERGLLPLVAVAGVPDSVFALSDRMERYRVPGVSLTVIDKERIAWSGAYGVREAGRPAVVTDTTVFEAGSISKSVAAATALRLVDQGRLTLDDDVNRTLRSWRVPSDSLTERRPVTLRALLSHSAGFNLPSFRGYQRGAALPTLTQILTGTAPANTPAARVEVAPGTEWRYSGAGMEVVRQLIEDATGRRHRGSAGPVRDVLQWLQPATRHVGAGGGLRAPSGHARRRRMASPPRAGRRRHVVDLQRPRPLRPCPRRLTPSELRPPAAGGDDAGGSAAADGFLGTRLRAWRRHRRLRDLRARRQHRGIHR